MSSDELAKLRTAYAEAVSEVEYAKKHLDDAKKSVRSQLDNPEFEKIVQPERDALEAANKKVIDLERQIKEAEADLGVQSRRGPNRKVGQCSRCSRFEEYRDTQKEICNACWLKERREILSADDEVDLTKLWSAINLPLVRAKRIGAIDESTYIKVRELIDPGFPIQKDLDCAKTHIHVVADRDDTTTQETFPNGGEKKEQIH
ncbi:MAG: hypothetical protein ACR2JB_04055 [Bryobacteraceae bacterium]